MMKIKKHILTKITSVLIIAGGLILSSSYAYAQSCGGSSCGNSTCSLSLGSDGILDTPCPSGTRYDVDPNCIMNQNASEGSCMDTMPVASINRVSETNCYRANGAGGNPNPRNHLGTDYAATQGTVVTAAADGKVVSAANMNGGGRTIIIEHEKVCQCTAGNAGGKCDDKYISVYMHLSAFLVNGGSVSKGQPIGKVGGSNYKNGVLCDYPDSNTSDGCKPYGPHLHFEIHSGAWEKGYSALKSSIINPLCDDIQQFCGGCSYDVQQCQGKEGAQEWENLSEEAAANKTQAASTGMNTPPVGSSSNGSSGSITQDGCPLSKFLPDDDTCWFCPMFKVLFNTASVIAKKAFEALASGIAAVVVVMFAIWISVYILKHVSAVEVKDPRKMLQELMLQAFKVVIVVLILVKANFFQVMQLTLEPVFNTGMTFVQAITGVGNSSACSSGSSYMQNIKGYDTSTGMTDGSSGGLPISMGQNIVCSIKTMQDSVAKMMAYGKQAWCVAWGPKSWLFGILPHFGFMITGIVIFLGGFILLLAFPWCLVDCVLQMSVASALAPAAIGAWAFKATKNYLKKIWDLFMNAMFNFVFLSIILYIIMTVVDQFMRGLDQYANESTGWDFLIHPINGLAYWGVTGTKLVVVCLMGWVFLDEGKKFADKFAKGGISGIGRSVGGLAAQAGTKAGKAAFSAGKTVGGAALQVGDHFVGSRVRQWRNDYRMNKVKTGYDNVIHDENGNITGYERTRRNLFGKKVTRRVMINEDGKEVWSKEKHSRRAEIGNFLHKKVNEARHELMFNRDRDENGNLINAKDILDEEGNLIARETEHGKVFYDKDGNETAREHYHRNLRGRKVTTREELGADGKWSMSRTKNSLRMEIMSKIAPEGSAINQFAQNHRIAKERDLSKQNLSSKVISSDKYMSIRQIKDNNGVVRQEDIAFNTQTIKHLINNKGEINTAMVEHIMQNSTFDRKTVMRAITMEVLKSRGIEVNNRFTERNITFDDKGRMFIKQTNMDGTSSLIEMEYGGPNGKQIVTKVTSYDRHGNVTTINKNNGIQKVDITVDDEGKQTAQYGFTDEYMRRYRYKKPLNRYGEYADTMDVKAATFGFGNYDHQLHTSQVATGKPQKYEEDKDDSRFDIPISGDQNDNSDNRTDEEKFVDLIGPENNNLPPEKKDEIAQEKLNQYIEAQSHLYTNHQQANELHEEFVRLQHLKLSKGPNITNEDLHDITLRMIHIKTQLDNIIREMRTN